MAGREDGGGYPWSDSSAGRPKLGHRISSISEISSPDEGGHRDSVVSLPSPMLEAQRPSSSDPVDISHIPLSSVGSWNFVSPMDGTRAQSPRSFLPDVLRAGTPTPPRYNPFSRSGSTLYSPVSAVEGQSSRSPLSSSGPRLFSTRSKGSFLSKRKDTIPQEDYDLNLLANAMPTGFSKQETSYPHHEHEGEDWDGPGMASAGVDLTSLTGGPLSAHEPAQLHEINKQEASGILTGGLGEGFRPSATITSSDLFANVQQPQAAPASLSRSLTRRMSFGRNLLARRPTLHDLGQSEANRRGEIIEVIVEEDADVDDGPRVDISTFTGGDSSRDTIGSFEQTKGIPQSRTSAVAPATVEVFFPQDNWKPHSMRWPYLTFLILLSITLAAAQEYLLHKSSQGPLFSFTNIGQLTTWNYFTIKYLPTVVAVSFGVLWQITDFEVKRLEAFYQLSKEQGALAAESLNVDYITFFSFLRPFRALQFKHYAVAVSSMATLMAVSLVPTLQTASLKLMPDRATRAQDPLGMKQIHIEPLFSRLLSIVLLLVATQGCVLLWQLQRRRSGLVADVKGIAGIAAMANRSHILMDFKDMDTATPEMIHQTLKAHRYSLRNSSLAPHEKIPLTQEDKDKYDRKGRPANPHPLMLRLVAGIPFIVGMLLFLGLIPLVLFQRQVNIITDKAPFFLTALAVTIKLTWCTLETDVRMIEPFYILSRRHAPPRVLTLDYTAMVFGWMPLRALLNGHFVIALVGLGTILAEVLIVLTSSFGSVFGGDFDHPQHKEQQAQRDGIPAGTSMEAGEETIVSFWVSFGLAITILQFLCFVAILVYCRRRHPFLPRQPNTIASILAFIHQSKMLYDFVGTEKMNNDEMVERLARIGKRYGLGWFTGRDGEVHCGVDEEELLRNYKHGDDARKASQPWTSDGRIVDWNDY